MSDVALVAIVVLVIGVLAAVVAAYQVGWSHRGDVADAVALESKTELDASRTMVEDLRQRLTEAASDFKLYADAAGKQRDADAGRAAVMAVSDAHDRLQLMLQRFPKRDASPSAAPSVGAAASAVQPANAGGSDVVAGGPRSGQPTDQGSRPT